MEAADPGAIANAAGVTLHHVAGLSPSAQVAAVIMLGLVLLALVGKPYVSLLKAGGGDAGEVLNLAVAAMNEQARATAALAEQVERVVEQNATIIARLPGNPQAQA